MLVNRILVVDGEESVANWFRAVLKDAGYFVRTAGSGSRALVEFDRGEWDLVFVDLSLPDTDGRTLIGKLKARHPGLTAVVMSDRSSSELGPTARDAEAFLEKPADLQPEGVLRLLQELRERPDSVSRWAAHGIIGKSAEMQKVFSMLDTVAATDGHVLVIGESGTGKKLIATAIHAVSARARKPLVKLVGSSSFEELGEGLVEANKGSLFVDQITDMPVELQQRLRIILEERRLRLSRQKRRAVDIDVRVLASAGLDPERAIRDHRLSPDLYYRIGVLAIRLPPLRERHGDLSLLVEHLLGRAVKKYGGGVTGMSGEAHAALQVYPWPGNVLELEQVIERAVIVAKGREVQVTDLPESVTVRRPTESPHIFPNPQPQTMTLEERERQAILAALEATGWNKGAAARLLGLYRPTLYSKMRKHGIPLRRPR